MIAVKKIIAISFLVLVFCTGIYGIPATRVASTHVCTNHVEQAIGMSANILTASYVMDMIDDDLSNENQLLFSATNFPDNFSSSFYPVNCMRNSSISPAFNKIKFARSEASFLMNFRI